MSLSIQQNLFSQVIGYVAIAINLFCTVPQFIELYRVKTGAGINYLLLFCWLMGDTLNLTGLILTDQWSESCTSVLCAIWFITSDLGLIGTVLYYDHLRPHIKSTKDIESESVDSYAPTEKSFLLANDSRSNDIEEKTKTVTTLLGVSLLCVGCFMYNSQNQYSYGLESSFVNSRSLLAVDYSSPVSNSHYMDMIGAIFGWVSTGFYLLSRLPQIYKNFQRKSCEGLGIGMFAFTIVANICYSVSIFTQSTEYEFLMTRLPWLLGALGTMSFDVIICLQYVFFNNGQKYMMIDNEVDSDNSDNEEVLVVNPEIMAEIK